MWSGGGRYSQREPAFPGAGGFVDNPRDPGGATNKQITLTTLRRWDPKATVTRLNAIADGLVQTICHHDYWKWVNGNLRPGRIGNSLSRSRVLFLNPIGH